MLVYIAAPAGRPFVVCGDVHIRGASKSVQAGVFDTTGRKYVLYELLMAYELWTELMGGITGWDGEEEDTETDMLLRRMFIGASTETCSAIKLCLEGDLGYGAAAFEQCGVDVGHSIGASGYGFFVAFPKEEVVA
jgi:hypothetical protein